MQSRLESLHSLCEFNHRQGLAYCKKVPFEKCAYSITQGQTDCDKCALDESLIFHNILGEITGVANV